MHKISIVHLNLSLESIKLSENNEIFILNFSKSKIQSLGFVIENYNSDNVLYKSPEQILCKSFNGNILKRNESRYMGPWNCFL